MVQITVEEGCRYEVISFLGSTHARPSWRGLPLLFGHADSPQTTIDLGLLDPEP